MDKAPLCSRSSPLIHEEKRLPYLCSLSRGRFLGEASSAQVWAEGRVKDMQTDSARWLEWGGGGGVKYFGMHPMKHLVKNWAGRCKRTGMTSQCPVDTANEKKKSRLEYRLSKSCILSENLSISGETVA